LALTIVSVTDPRWTDAEHTTVDVIARFAEIDDDLPFTATPWDTEAHGQEIYTKAVAGEYGEIAEYIPPSDEELARQMRNKRAELLYACDWTQFPDVPQATRDAWAPYRQALRDVTSQSGFPQNIIWPTKP
jgi:hypothetical protein